MGSVKKTVLYFDEPGPQNTDAVIQAVKERLQELGIKHVVVASESGRTALKVAEALRELNVNVVCVTAYAAVRRKYEEELPPGHYLSDEMREKLRGLGVKVLEESFWPLSGSTVDYAFLGEQGPSMIVHQILSRLLGYGFKTAIEVALVAADVGAIPVDQEAIAIAGTGWAGGGADCAIVVKPAGIFGKEFLDVEKGMEVREIIAMPRPKFKFKREIIEEIRERGI